MEMSNTRSDGLELYEQVFAEMLATDSSEMISNASAQHAIVLIRQLLCHAGRTVKVFCKSLAEDVWGDESVLKAIREAQANDVQLTFVTQTGVTNEKLLSLLRGYEKASVRRYRFETPKANFILIDDKSFRFEPDPDRREGFAYARSPENAKLLQEAFDDILASSDEVAEWRSVSA